MVFVKVWLGLVVLLGACVAPVAAPSPSVTVVPTATQAPAPTAPPTASALPSAASGGIEVFATGQLHGTYVWVVGEVAEAQDRVTELLYAVPLDGSPAKLAVRRLRPRAGVILGGYTVTGIVPDRQITRDGVRLVLEQAPIGPAAHDGLVLVDLAAGTIREIARGDQRNDVMPAWSPDGTRIAYARRNVGSAPVTRDDGLWVIRADGSGMRQLQPAAQFAQVTYVFGWTADGRGIAFGLAFEGLGYSVVDATTATVSAWPGAIFGLAPASWRTKTPQLAIAFSEGDKGGTQSIQIADGIGRPAAIVASEPPAGQTTPIYLSARWHPADDDILFIRLDSRSTLMRVGLAGGARQVKTDGEPLHAEWLPDGRIAYTTKTGALSVTNGSDVTVLWTPAAGTATDLAIRPYR